LDFGEENAFLKQHYLPLANSHIKLHLNLLKNTDASNPYIFPHTHWYSQNCHFYRIIKPLTFKLFLEKGKVKVKCFKTITLNSRSLCVQVCMHTHAWVSEFTESCVERDYTTHFVVNESKYFRASIFVKETKGIK